MPAGLFMNIHRLPTDCCSMGDAMPAFPTHTPQMVQHPMEVVVWMVAVPVQDVLPRGEVIPWDVGRRVGDGMVLIPEDPLFPFAMHNECGK